MVLTLRLILILLAFVFFLLAAFTSGTLRSLTVRWEWLAFACLTLVLISA